MDIMKKHNMCFSVQYVRDIHSFVSIPMSDMQIIFVCVTLCDKHPYMIGMELTKLLDAEESDGSVAADALMSLLPYGWIERPYPMQIHLI